MGLNIEEKKAVVSDMHEVFLNSQAVVAAEYSGLTVSQMTKLRREARALGLTVRVAKNSLAKLAIAGTDHECLGDDLIGPLILIISKDDPGAGARLVKEFANENEQLIAKAIAFGGESRPGTDLNLLASMPTLDEARAKLLSVLNGPATTLLRLLKEPSSVLVRVLVAKNQKSE